MNATQKLEKQRAKARVARRINWNRLFAAKRKVVEEQAFLDAVESGYADSGKAD